METLDSNGGKVGSIAERVVDSANNKIAVAIFRYFIGIASAILIALGSWTLSAIQRVEVGLAEQSIVNRTQEQRLDAIDRAVSIVNSRIDTTRIDLTNSNIDRYRALDAERDLRLRDQRITDHDRRIDQHDRRFEQMEQQQLQQQQRPGPPSR